MTAVVVVVVVFVVVVVVVVFPKLGVLPQTTHHFGVHNASKQLTTKYRPQHPLATDIDL